jgi:hypothetical protein
MATATTLEERLSNLEAVVEDMRRRVPPEPKHWLEAMHGMFENEPLAEEIIRYGKEFRDSDRPPAEPGA